MIKIEMKTLFLIQILNSILKNVHSVFLQSKFDVQT